METLLLILLLIAMSAANIVCFIIGAKVGQASSNGEKIPTPTLNPLRVMREREDRKEAERAQDRYDTIMRNIESYDGTPNGQEDVPRG